MAKIISITNLKGGVGKTTTCLNMAAALRRLGKKVLMVDWDPQGNLSATFGLDQDGTKTFWECFDLSSEDYYQADKISPYTVNEDDGFLLLPSNFTLSEYESTFSSEPGGEFALKNALSRFSETMDFVIIDTNPSVSVLTISAYHASDYLVIPVQKGMYSESGMERIAQIKARINKHYGRSLTILGVVFTMFKENLVISRDYKDRYAESNIQTFQSHIRENVSLSECVEMGMDIFRYDAFLSQEANKTIVSAGAEDYYEFALEALSKLGMAEGQHKAREASKKIAGTRRREKGGFKQEFLDFLKEKKQ